MFIIHFKIHFLPLLYFFRPLFGKGWIWWCEFMGKHRLDSLGNKFLKCWKHNSSSHTWNVLLMKMKFPSDSVAFFPLPLSGSFLITSDCDKLPPARLSLCLGWNKNAKKWNFAKCDKIQRARNTVPSITHTNSERRLFQTCIYCNLMLGLQFTRDFERGSFTNDYARNRKGFILTLVSKNTSF